MKKKKCKFIGYPYSYLNLQKNNTYYYLHIKEGVRNYEMYKIYDNEQYLTTYNKRCFDLQFIDTTEERKQKLLKIQNL